MDLRDEYMVLLALNLLVQVRKTPMQRRVSSKIHLKAELSPGRLDLIYLQNNGMNNYDTYPLGEFQSFCCISI